MTSSLALRALACTTVLLVLLYHFSTTLTTCLPSHHHHLTSTMSTATTTPAVDPSTHLSLALAQTARAPPTLSLAVTNTHPSATLTFVAWNTPLDPAALPLGLLAVVDPASGRRLNNDSIAFARRTPPEPDAFVSLRPGESRAHEVELRDGPLVPLGKVAGGKVEVRVVEGEWRDVWVDEVVGPAQWEGRSGKGLAGKFGGDGVVVDV